MTNLEKYKDKILDKGYYFALHNNELFLCENFSCHDCEFSEYKNGCNEARINWLIKKANDD